MADGLAGAGAGLPHLDDRYVPVSLLGAGGKARVFLADDRLLRRQVAIKVFHANAETSEALQEQENEAKLIASLNHYALTSLFDAGVDVSDSARPQIYLVMEYIPGRDLRQRLNDGPLQWFQVCWLGRDLAEGLFYLHESGFLHRDIKPGNVLLASKNADVRLRGKLADFGLSSLVGADADDEYVTGTAAYLAPEQVRTETATAASDTYALGLVLLEALTGQVAFPGSIEQSAFARLDHDPDIPASIPIGIRRILAKMTALEPTERPSLPEVASAFQNLLIDDLVRQRGYAAPTTAELAVVQAQKQAIDQQIQAREVAAQERAAEVERVAALRRYNVVDRPADTGLERITRLAQRWLKVPYAAVSFVDADRVWMQARQGLEAEQLDRDVAACVLRADPGAWTVPDMLADTTTANLDMVQAPGGPRSYAAAPLITYDGHSLGGLCVFDSATRNFTDDELQALTDLAAIIMSDLELRLAARRALFTH